VFWFFYIRSALADYTLNVEHRLTAYSKISNHWVPSRSISNSVNSDVRHGSSSSHIYRYVVTRVGGAGPRVPEQIISFWTDNVIRIFTVINIYFFYIFTKSILWWCIGHDPDYWRGHAPAWRTTPQRITRDSKVASAGLSPLCLLQQLVIFIILFKLLKIFQIVFVSTFWTRQAGLKIFNK
jgi:hypothetical protein